MILKVDMNLKSYYGNLLNVLNVRKNCFLIKVFPIGCSLTKQTSTTLQEMDSLHDTDCFLVTWK